MPALPGTAPQRGAAAAWLALGAVACVLVPTAFVAWRQGQDAARALLTGADNLLVYGIVLTLFVAAARTRAATALGWSVAVPAALYFAALSLLIAYWLVVGHQFDLFFALDASADVYGTLARTLGAALWLLLAGIALLALGWLALLLRLFAAVRRLAPALFAGWLLALPLALQGAGLWLNRGEQRLVVEEIRNLWQVARDRAVIAPIFPATGDYRTTSRDPVFILQLESGNALALTGGLELHGRRYDGDYLPQTRAIARDGVFFPRFWSNSIQSNRAVVNLLCGVTNNLGRALSYNPEKIVTDCLPRLLQRSGYRTAFFVAFSALDFMNYAAFVPALGFDALWDSRITGAPEGTDEWGVDDCQFYRAMFDVLRREYAPEGLFVYAEVSAHHFPFPTRAAYEHVHPFRPAGTFVESYLNSYAEQDHCLDTFYREFRAYAGDRAHLFIVPDHSWPVGIHGNTWNEAQAYAENFLVPVVYVPPAADRDAYRVGEVSALAPAHTDLLPTVFALLNDRPYPNSFAFALRRDGGTPDYEACQVLVQPYGGGEIVIVRGDETLRYRVRDQTLVRYDLGRDPWQRAPELVATALPYATLRARYYCDRYRP